MAGNKLNTKMKGKEDRGRGNKGVTQNNDDCEDMTDFAILRKPVPTSVTGFAQARKIFDLATEELKDLLANECDMLYECKVCRNIFRSLANFISHKRIYCKEKFSSTVHSHFVNSSSTADNEMLQIKRTEDAYQESLKIKTGTDTSEVDDRIPLTKDITAVYEKIIDSKDRQLCKEDRQVVLKKIPSSNVAVFQNLGVQDKTTDSMKAEVQEIDQILSRKRAVLQSDGKFIIENDIVGDPDRPDFDNVIQISDDEDNHNGDVLKCKICDLQFSTLKTLKFHMKYKHLESRLVYPCPDCLEIFSTSWSVYRHLFKVHRKTAAQIRRLRESIQSKAFKMNNPPAYYEKRKNMKPSAPQQITEEERRDQENQAWMDNMEGDGEVPRCGGCGRTFERRAALAAHTHTCQPRSRALARPPRPDRRIEIQIRKDYHKGPPPPPPDAESKPVPEETEPKSKPAKEDEDKNVDKETEKHTEKETDTGKDVDMNEDDDDPPMDIDDDDQKSNISGESPEKLNEVKLHDNIKPVIRLPYALQAEKSNLAAFKQRISADIDIAKLQCKKCDLKYTNVIELYEHMSDHVKWIRYACKLCNFKHYSFEKLPEHVKVVHKLKGDSDFYYSTVKAIDGKEAMIISTCLAEPTFSEEANDTEASPDSRRPSRCSSDSSRMSDDSSSSTTLKETASRKRKIHPNKSTAKKKKETNDDGEDREQKGVKIIWADNINSPSLKASEENSSDTEDIEERISTTHILDITASVSSRRPVRKRTKVKNADFEYDLSNLLKMEAQGYRDSQTTANTKVTPVSTTKAPQPKKKVQPETPSNNDAPEILNQDYCGALTTLSKKAVENAFAHMRTTNFAVYSAKEQRSNVFVRPMLPRILARNDKASPKKDLSEELKENSIQNKVYKISETVTLKSLESNDNERKVHNDKDAACQISQLENDIKVAENIKTGSANDAGEKSEAIEQNGTDPVKKECNVADNLNIPAVVPIKFRRQSLELMKNHPIINKNITDFSKAGMKTKILVIKPIHRDKDGKRLTNAAPLKFQTIKLKDKGLSNDDKSSDQVMVVKVPKVSCTSVSEKIVLPTPDTNVAANGITDKTCEDTELINNANKDKNEPVAENIKDSDCKSNETRLEPVSNSLVEEPANVAGKSNAIEIAAT